MKYCTNYCDSKQLLQRHPLRNPPRLRTPNLPPTPKWRLRIQDSLGKVSRWGVPESEGVPIPESIRTYKTRESGLHAPALHPQCSTKQSILKFHRPRMFLMETRHSQFLDGEIVFQQSDASKVRLKGCDLSL